MTMILPITTPGEEEYYWGTRTKLLLTIPVLIKHRVVAIDARIQRMWLVG